jgi:hypothetical protein
MLCPETSITTCGTLPGSTIDTGYYRAALRLPTLQPREQEKTLMVMPRRKFLASSLLFGASAALMLGNTRSVFANESDDIPIESQRNPLFMFTAATFEPYIGGYFQTRNARGQLVALKLLKVESFDQPNKITGKAVKTNSFSLLFVSDERLPRFTSIYTIEHGALGKFDLFLTPRTGKNGELLYEAVFNHVS